MGTFGTGILHSDDALDIHGEYIEFYNSGLTPIQIRASLEQQFRSYFEDEIIEENVGFWLGLAQAQWECTALDEDILGYVSRIIEEDLEMDLWGKEYPQRLRSLKRFHKKIRKAKKSPRRRVRPKQFSLPFSAGDCIITADDGGYGGAICLFADPGKSKSPSMIAATLRLHQPEKPSLEDFLDSHVVVANYERLDGRPCGLGLDPTPAVGGYFGSDPEHIRHAWSHEIAGNLHLERIYGSTIYGSCRGFPFSTLHENQLRWEQDHPEAVDLRYPVSQILCESPAHADFGRKFAESQVKDTENHEARCRAAMEALKLCTFQSQAEVIEFVMSYCLCSRARAENRFKFVRRAGRISSPLEKR